MRKKIGVFLLMIIMMIPGIVMAKSPEVTISGPDSSSVNEKIDYTISMKVDGEATSFESTIKYNTDVLELTSILKKDNWQGNNTVSNSGNNTIKFTNTGVSGETNIVTLRFRVKSSEKSSITLSAEDIKVMLSSSDGQEAGTIVTADSAKKDTIIKSDDNTLKNIKLDNKTISGFKSTVYTYTLEVDSLTDSLKIDATLNNDKTSSFVDKFGPRIVSLEYGQNEVLLKTKSESEKEATYTLTIIRKDDRVSNNDLKSIILNGGSIKLDFSKSRIEYKDIVTYKLEKIDVDAVADDPDAKVEVKAPNKLIIGENTIKIIVTPVTGDPKTYTIIVTNSEVPTDIRLRNLSVIGIGIGFNSDTYKYSIRYNKSYKNGLTLKYTTYSDNTKVEEIGNSNLKPGSVVKVVVKALDGSNNTEEYTITLEKDNRISFFLILDVIIALIVTILIIIQLKKRKKRKQEEKLKNEEDLEKTKELKL